MMGLSIRAVWPSARVALAGMAIFAAFTFPAWAQTAAPGTVAMSEPNAAQVAPAPFATYNNKWQLYGGLNYANGQAGQDLPDRFNMGGLELMGTRWLGSKTVKTWGIAADYRLDAGTTQAAPAAKVIGLDRTLVMEHIFTAGVEYRTPFRNRYVGVDAHAMGGGAYGIFNYAITHNPSYPNLPVAACPAQVTITSPVSTGLYCNHTAPYGIAGISLDFNDTAKLAIRLQPDMTFEHFGTETREFFSISLGAMYRFGDPKKK